MFDLEKAIVDWRSQLASGGIHSTDVLDELESHLREEVRAMTAGGKPEAEAFEAAVTRLGSAKSMRAEFAKVRPASSLAKRAIVTAALAVLFLLLFDWGSPRILLITHTLALTVGYLAVFLAGAIGICGICGDYLQRLSGEEETLSGLASLLLKVATAAVLAGLLLGLLWSGIVRQHFFVWHLRELGTLVVLAWLIIVWTVQRNRQLGAQAFFVLCVAGNILVGLAWFGAGVTARGQSFVRFWPLDVVLVLSLLFLVLGLVPHSPVKEDKSYV